MLNPHDPTADAARNRWCEKRQADVRYNIPDRDWVVSWFEPPGKFLLCSERHEDRNAAIDMAMESPYA